MKPRVAVCGAGSAGHTMAADLTFAGYEVNLFEHPQFKQNIEGIQKHGGIFLRGVTRSGKTGFAVPHKVTTDPKEAIEDVDVIMIVVPGFGYDLFIKAITPYLKDGQVLLFNTPYWASLRFASYLKEMGKENVILAESTILVYLTDGRDGFANCQAVKSKVPLAAFPAKKTKEALNILKPIYPSFEMATNVLEINFENLNSMIHPGILLANLGWLERERAKEDEMIPFYKEGATTLACQLLEAVDNERIKCAKAFGIDVIPLKEHLYRYYDAKGETMYEAIQNCKPYQGIRIPANVCLRMPKQDVALGMVPWVLLGDFAGVNMPKSRGIIEVFGGVLGIDFWEAGLTLEKLGLAGLAPKEVVKYVTEGIARAG